LYLILLVMTLHHSVSFGLRRDFIVGGSYGTIPSQGSRDFAGAESTGSCLKGNANATLLHARSDVSFVLQRWRVASDGATDNLVFAPDLSPLGRFCCHSDVSLTIAIATFLGAVSSNRTSGCLLGEGNGRVASSCRMGDAHALLFLARKGVGCQLKCTRGTGYGAADLHVFDAPSMVFRTQINALLAVLNNSCFKFIQVLLLIGICDAVVPTMGINF